MIITRRTFSGRFALVFMTAALTLTGIPQANAETRYVAPSAEVVVRTGQGNEFKIVSMVKDGSSVELLEESDYYSKVRLGNGKEGWMLRRYLSAEKPLAEVVASLRAEKEEFILKGDASEKALDQLEEDLAGTKAELKASNLERDRAKKEFETLKMETADVVGIKNSLLKIQDEDEELSDKLTVLEKENARLKKDRAVNWFLAGAGVLFAGMLMGRLPKPTRRRKSSLLS